MDESAWKEKYQATNAISNTFQVLRLKPEELHDLGVRRKETNTVHKVKPFSSIQRSTSKTEIALSQGNCDKALAVDDVML